jgi:hypothetical protein
MLDRGHRVRGDAVGGVLDPARAQLGDGGREEEAHDGEREGADEERHQRRRASV